MNILQTTLIDLTHTISADIPTWNGTSEFEQHTVIDYSDCTTNTKFRVQKLCMSAGIGTHMDAPAHCIPQAASIEFLKLSTLLAPCAVIDVGARSHAEYSISRDDIKQFEQKYGTIKAGTLVACNTGWDKFWTDAKAYRNNLVFPSISADAAQYLANRNIAGIAIDTLGVDRPQEDFIAHQILLSAGIYIIENATNLEKLPPTGAFTIALPIKIANGTEAPIRFIGLINK